MAQVRIYGLRASLADRRPALSRAIHDAVVRTLQYPPEKRFHRFLALEPEDFLFPADRSADYTIVEISMFQGRTVEAKKALVRALFDNIERETGIAPQDVEITLFETPRENWGIRGCSGDELGLGYKVEV